MIKIFNATFVLSLLFLCVANVSCNAPEPLPEGTNLVNFINKTDSSISIAIANPNKEDMAFLIRKKDANRNQEIELPKAEKITNNISIEQLQNVADAKLISILSKNQNNEININGLLSKTVYSIDIYKVNKGKGEFVQNFETNTVDLPPTSQAASLTFGMITDSSFASGWSAGGEKNTMLIVSQKPIMSFPKNGQTYNAGKFGDPSCKIDDSEVYVVYKGFQPTALFPIENLAFGEYHVMAITFTGENGFEHYNLTPGNNNLRTRWTLLKQPKINKAEWSEDNVVRFTWDNVPLAENYYIMVAMDPKAEMPVDEYNNAEIGEISEMEVFLEDMNKTYYLFVMARNNKTESRWSEPYIIEPKN